MTLATIRTARKPHHCDSSQHSAPRLIAPGQRYAALALPPGSDLGNDSWWHIAECLDCAISNGRGGMEARP